MQREVSWDTLPVTVARVSFLLESSRIIMVPLDHPLGLHPAEVFWRIFKEVKAF